MAAKKAVSRYYAMIDFFGQFRDVFVPTQLALGKIEREVLEPGLRGGIFNEEIAANRGANASCGSVEGWYRQVDQTSRHGSYRDRQIESMEVVLAGWMGCPGTREIWTTCRDAFALVAYVVDRALGSESEDQPLE